MSDINLDDLPAYIEGLQAEIERLRGLLREWIDGNIDHPWEWEQRVREALGERDE